MSSSFRVVTEEGTAHYPSEPCYYNFYRLMNCLKKRPSVARVAQCDGQAGFLEHFKKSMVFRSFLMKIRKNNEENITRLSSIINFRPSKFKVPYLYVKLSQCRTVDTHVIEEMYRILKNFKGFSRYVTKYDKGVDVLKENKELGIKVDGCPIYLVYLFCYTVRLLDEKYSPGVQKMLEDITPYMTPNYAMLLVLLYQSGYYCYQPRNNMLYLGSIDDRGEYGHCLHFLCKKNYSRNNKLILRKGAVDSILQKGSLDYFFERWAKGKEYFNDDDYKDETRKILMFFGPGKDGPAYRYEPKLPFDLTSCLEFINSLERRGRK